MMIKAFGRGDKALYGTRFGPHLYFALNDAKFPMSHIFPGKTTFGRAPIRVEILQGGSAPAVACSHPSFCKCLSRLIHCSNRLIAASTERKLGYGLVKRLAILHQEKMIGGHGSTELQLGNGLMSFSKSARHQDLSETGTAKRMVSTPPVRLRIPALACAMELRIGRPQEGPKSIQTTSEFRAGHNFGSHTASLFCAFSEHGMDVVQIGGQFSPPVASQCKVIPVMLEERFLEIAIAKSAGA